MTVPGFEWLGVLRAYTHLGVGIYRHPDDVARGEKRALALAYELARDGHMHRSPATGYFALTPAGETLAKSLEALP